MSIELTHNQPIETKQPWVINMFVTVFSKIGGVFTEVSGWAIATGQAQAVVFQQGEDGPYCQVRF